MNDVVLDASAVLALLNREPGAEAVEGALGRASMSAVNAAEVLSKLVDAGLELARAREAFALLGVSVVPFDATDAEVVASLRPVTKSRGLSLGDRACLALGRRFDAVVLTADRSWAELGIGRVETIR